MGNFGWYTLIKTTSYNPSAVDGKVGIMPFIDHTVCKYLYVKTSLIPVYKRMNEMWCDASCVF